MKNEPVVIGEKAEEGILSFFGSDISEFSARSIQIHY
jgi:hypothetical protein